MIIFYVNRFVFKIKKLLLYKNPFILNYQQRNIIDDKASYFSKANLIQNIRYPTDFTNIKGKLNIFIITGK